MEYTNKLNLIKARYINRKLDSVDNKYESKSVSNVDNSANTRLPFGLCKKYNIKIGKDWSPKDAWDALKEKGITPDDAYEELKSKGTESVHSKINEVVTNVKNAKGDTKAENKATLEFVNSLEAGDTIVFDDDPFEKYEMIEKDGVKSFLNDITDNFLYYSLKEVAEQLADYIRFGDKVTFKKNGSNDEIEFKNDYNPPKENIVTVKQEFSKEDKDNARWNTFPEQLTSSSYDIKELRKHIVKNAEYADSHYTKYCTNIPSDQMDAIRKYTQVSRDINIELSKGKVSKVAEKLTGALSGCTSDENFWVQSGWSISKLKNLFGCYPDKLKVGMEAVNDGFCSCGFDKNSGFTTKPVIVNFYCPKGTEGMYIAPISIIMDENEYIMQRGAKLRVAKISFKDDVCYVDVDVLGHEY